MPSQDQDGRNQQELSGFSRELSNRLQGSLQDSALPGLTELPQEDVAAAGLQMAAPYGGFLADPLPCRVCFTSRRELTGKVESLAESKLFAVSRCLPTCRELELSSLGKSEETFSRAAALSSSLAFYCWCFDFVVFAVLFHAIFAFVGGAPVAERIKHGFVQWHHDDSPCIFRMPRVS